MLVQQVGTGALALEPLSTSQGTEHRVSSSNLQVFGLKLFSARWLSGDGDPSSPYLQGSCFSYHIKLFSTFVLSLGNFLCYFVLFTSRSVSFLYKMMLLSLDVFFPLWIQFLLPSDSHSLNPFCTPEKFLFAGGTENENFFSLHSFSFAHTIPAKSLWSKKPNHTIGINSFLDCMAVLSCALPVWWIDQIPG